MQQKMLPKITLVSGPAQLRQWIVQPKLSAREVTAQSSFCELSQLGYLLCVNVKVSNSQKFTFPTRQTEIFCRKLLYALSLAIKYLGMCPHFFHKICTWRSHKENGSKNNKRKSICYQTGNQAKDMSSLQGKWFQK